MPLIKIVENRTWCRSARYLLALRMVRSLLSERRGPSFSVTLTVFLAGRFCKSVIQSPLDNVFRRFDARGIRHYTAHNQLKSWVMNIVVMSSRLEMASFCVQVRSGNRKKKKHVVLMRLPGTCSSCTEPRSRSCRRARWPASSCGPDRCSGTSWRWSGCCAPANHWENIINIHTPDSLMLLGLSK